MTEIIKVSIQTKDFNIQEQSELLRAASSEVGAIVTFTGLVRDLDNASVGSTGNPKVSSLFLEHYPGMTENSLKTICLDAAQRWDILASSIVHRIGKLNAAEQIVFVGVSSLHRKEAFAACEFIMDYLKTQAPFWKKSYDEKGEHWVDAKVSDEQAVKKWHKSKGPE